MHKNTIRTYLIVLLLFAGTFISITAAPAPGPRRHRTEYLHTGYYQLLWNAQEWDIVLEPGNKYRASASASASAVSNWEGTWNYNRRTRILSVREWRVRPLDSVLIVWSVKLDHRLCGVTDTGINVKLTRRK